MFSVSNEFLFATRTPRNNRTEKELSVIYSYLRRLEPFRGLAKRQLRGFCPYVRFEFYEPNTVLFKKGDQCRCWYVLLSGAVFIQGSMFLPYHCFGKQLPGSKRRGYQCMVLETSEMIAIDYPEIMSIQTAGDGTHPHALRRAPSLEQALEGSANEVDTASSSEQGSPFHGESIQSNNDHPMMTSDNLSQLSFSNNMDDDEYTEPDIDEEDTISLHSTSSLFIKDLVIDVLKKEADERTEDDLEILMEFTKSLQAFSNMTEPIRRSLCKVMVFAWVEHAGTVVLKDGELLDSWSVIINGQVQNKTDEGEKILGMGHSFGVKPTLQAQQQRGTMTTMCEECQFFCIAQQDYYNVLHQGKENIENITNENDEVVMVKEKREIENGLKKGNIAIRGTADCLMQHMLEENVIDTTYIEDFLLTYRVFDDDPMKMCKRLLEWFDEPRYRDKVVKIILIWVNNHFKDFESDWKMMDLLEKFNEKLHQCDTLQGQTKLFNIACSAKAKPRVVTINRASSDAALGFDIIGGSENDVRHPIYVCAVTSGSDAEDRGVKRGDQLLEVNGQNFEKIALAKAQAILKKNTDLSLTLKTNVFAFKELMSDLKNPGRKQPKLLPNGLDRPSNTLRVPSLSTSSEGELHEASGGKHGKKGGTLGRASRKIARIFKRDSTNFSDFLVQHGESVFEGDERGVTTIDGHTRYRHSATLSHSSPDLLDPFSFERFPQWTESPDDVIKVYRADQLFRIIYVSKDTTAGDAVKSACREFGAIERVDDYALYKVSVQGENFVKQSKLPEPWSKLAELPLGSRYYLKNTMNSEQLLPDENIPELLKEANFTFLDLDCFEIAYHITREDYKLFQQTEPSHFIDDLFKRDAELKKFKAFEDLVNSELFWVVTTICSEPSVVQRAKLIKHFIKVAHHCKSLKNFNSTFALVSGLGYRAVSRLKLTWDKVPAKSIRLFEDLQALMDPSRNMSKYRTLLSEHTHQPPVIPYIPVVKKDLTFLHLGNDTHVDGLVNFEKMRMLSKEVRNISRLCVPDVSQIVPVDSPTPKDSEKAARYQTLARKNRRGSLNNARRMYEDKMNARRVKQYMQQIVVVSDEEKLIEMSKIVETQQVSTLPSQKRRNTGSNLTVDSAGRPSKASPNSTLSRADSIGSTSSAHSRNTLESHLPHTNDPVKKKTPSSTLPRYFTDSGSPQMLSKKLSGDGSSEKRNEPMRKKSVRRTVSENSRGSTPIYSPIKTRKRHDPLNEADNNNVIGFENLNVNNNRHDVITGGSSASLDRVTAPAGLKKSLSTKSVGSSGRGSLTSAACLGAVSTSNPAISTTGSGENSFLYPGPGKSRISQSNTAPPNLMNSKRKSPPEPRVILTPADLAMAADSFQIGLNDVDINASREQLTRSTSMDSGIADGDTAASDLSKTDVPEEEIFGSVSYQQPNAPPPSRRDLSKLSRNKQLQQLQSSSEEYEAAIPDLIQHRSQSDDERINDSPRLSDQDDDTDIGRRNPTVPPPTTFGPNQCSGYAIARDTSTPYRPPANGFATTGRAPSSRRQMKTIHDFVSERHGALPPAPVYRAPISYPFMQPNYTRNMPLSASDALMEEELMLALRRQERFYQANKYPTHRNNLDIGRQGSLGRMGVDEYDGDVSSRLTALIHSSPAHYNVYTTDKSHRYMNLPVDGDNRRLPPVPPGSEETDYENRAVINKAMEEQRRMGRRNAPRPHPPPPPSRASIGLALQRQEAVDQQWAAEQGRHDMGSNRSPVTSLPRVRVSEDYALHALRADFQQGRHLRMASDPIDQNPPPPPKRTTSIGRTLQLKSNIGPSPHFSAPSVRSLPEMICEEVPDEQYLYPIAERHNGHYSTDNLNGYVDRRPLAVHDDVLQMNEKQGVIGQPIRNCYARCPVVNPSLDDDVSDIQVLAKLVTL